MKTGFNNVVLQPMNIVVNMQCCYNLLCLTILTVTLTLLTKALRSKRREVFFVYFRQLKNRLCCCYIKTLPRCCNLVILLTTMLLNPVFINRGCLGVFACVILLISLYDTVKNAVRGLDQRVGTCHDERWFFHAYSIAILPHICSPL